MSSPYISNTPTRPLAGTAPKQNTNMVFFLLTNNTPHAASGKLRGAPALQRGNSGMGIGTLQKVNSAMGIGTLQKGNSSLDFELLKPTGMVPIDDTIHESHYYHQSEYDGSILKHAQEGDLKLLKKAIKRNRSQISTPETGVCINYQ
jgi:hypothetical protein